MRVCPTVTAYPAESPKSSTMPRSVRRCCRGTPNYVSHGSIKLYGNNDPAFTIQHKTGKGVGHPVRAKDFKANILCTKHNSYLQPADDTALEFAKFLRRNALNYDAGAGDWGEAEQIRRPCVFIAR